MNLPFKQLGTLALLSLLATSVSAAGADDDAAGPVCGTLDPVAGKNVIEGAQQCSCSGSITLTVTALGTYTAAPGSLVCESVAMYPSYDGFKAGGDTMMRADRWVNDMRIDRTCDTSDCWWFFPFSGGTATCASNTMTLPGGHTSYIVIGTCDVPDNIVE